MRLVVLRETADGEHRVAATPETVRKLTALGATVQVEAGAGEAATISDTAYSDAGASVLPDREALVAGADALLCVQAPPADALASARPGTALIGIASPYGDRDRIDRYAMGGLAVMAMEFMPRITRAQSMDVLSSQSNLAGYKAVLDATAEFRRALPMMMTAAGTIPAARVFVMGVGVAGLQAIATARRLGAIVSATDVRAATKEQVESLGAKFVMVEDEESKAAETTGGYAREMSDAYKAKQAQLISDTIGKQDIVITTALIPGRTAPVLVTDAQVASMKPGSVIVDLAVEQGGNVEGSAIGEVVRRHGVAIVGHRNMPSRLASDASALYARNIFNFISAFWDKDANAVRFDPEDDIIKGVKLTDGGQVVHQALLAAA